MNIIKQQPIFIFASGLRCGSTLLQRFLNSHKNFFIWGEHGGILKEFEKAYNNMKKRSSRFEDDIKNYKQKGYDSWTANMSPSFDHIVHAYRVFVYEYISRNAIQLKQGSTRFGFKETRYGYDMYLFFTSLFPNCRIIHMVRNIEDCYLSLKKWEGSNWKLQDIGSSIQNWKKVNRSFMNVKTNKKNYHLLKYENLIGNTNKEVNELCRFIGSNINDFNMNVFNKKIHGCGSNGLVDNRRNLQVNNFHSKDWDYILSDNAIEISQHYGYTLRRN